MRSTHVCMPEGQCQGFPHTREATQPAEQQRQLKAQAMEELTHAARQAAAAVSAAPPSAPVAPAGVTSRGMGVAQAHVQRAVVGRGEEARPWPLPPQRAAVSAASETVAVSPGGQSGEVATVMRMKGGWDGKALPQTSEYENTRGRGDAADGAPGAGFAGLSAPRLVPSIGQATVPREMAGQGRAAGGGAVYEWRFLHHNQWQQYDADVSRRLVRVCVCVCVCVCRVCV